MTDTPQPVVLGHRMDVWACTCGQPLGGSVDPSMESHRAEMQPRQEAVLAYLLDLAERQIERECEGDYHPSTWPQIITRLVRRESA